MLGEISVVSETIFTRAPAAGLPPRTRAAHGRTVAECGSRPHTRTHPRAPDHESEPPAGRWNIEYETVEKNGRNREARTRMLLDHISRTWFCVRSVRAPACGAAGRWSLSFAATATATPPRVDLGSASPSLYPATRPCLAWASPFHSPFTVHGIAMTL